MCMEYVICSALCLHSDCMTLQKHVGISGLLSLYATGNAARRRNRSFRLGLRQSATRTRSEHENKQRVIIKYAENSVLNPP